MSDRASLSIGAKLTLRYTAAVTVTVTVVALFVYTQVENRINREARLLLEVQAQELADDYAAVADSEPGPKALRWMESRLERLVHSTDPELHLGVELVSQTGERQLAVGSLTADAPPVSEALLDGRQPRLLRAINLGQERPYLAMAVRVPGGAVRVAIDTERYANNVRHVRDVFLWSLPVVLLATAGIGWLLARGSLRPIQQISESARRISAANLAEAIPDSGSGDELDQLAGTLNEMLGRLQDGVSRMRRFNANAAHQLRTPLTALSNQLEVTLEKPRDAVEYQRVLGDALARVHSLASGVEGMLRLSQVEAGLQPGERQPVSLAEVVGTVCEFFDPVAQESGIDLSVGDVPDTRVVGDASWLHQLFSNLIANALQYTGAGGRVAVQGRLTSDGAEIEVRDTGAGIPGDALKHIFERFERGEAGASGFGLGLPIALEIARAHGGRIDLASEPGKGTRVTVCLPRPHAEGPA